MPENSSQSPQAAGLETRLGKVETRVSLVEAELKHLATRADLEKGLNDLGRELTREMRHQLYAILAAMGVMVSALVGGALAYAHLSNAQALPPPPPALEAPVP